MKIAKLTISNFLKLKDVEINPSKANVIVGKNKQGKTSVLKAIKAAFTGDADSSSIRIGETKAEITIDLDDLVIHRTITEKGNYLDVSNKEGFKVPSPQKYLDGILGTFSFNPIDFFNMKATERKKYLLKAVDMRITQDELAAFTGEKLTGLDYEGAHALEIVKQAYDYYYAQRTTANAEVLKKQKTLSELSSKIPDGFDPSNYNEGKVVELRKAVTENEVNKQKVASCNDSVERLKNEIAAIRTQLADKESMLKIREEELVEMQSKIRDTDSMYIELQKMDAQRDLVFANQQVETVRAELSEAITSQERLDKAVKALAKEVPQKLIEKANLPVEGLTITEDDVLVNGVSLDNLSTSEQLKFGLDIVRKLNATFKVVCIDGIEALDIEAFQWFLKEIENDDFQYFVSRVSTNENIPHSIIIDNGEVQKEIENTQATV